MRALLALGAAAVLMAVTAWPPTVRGSSVTGDVNGDCIVDIRDLSLVASRYLAGIGSQLYSPQYDLNDDGVINILDIQIVAGHYLEVCMPDLMMTATPEATATPDPTLDGDGDGYPDVLEISFAGNPYQYCVVMRADVNMSGKVTLADLIMEAGWYNQTIPPAPARYDQDASRKIQLADLIITAGVYGGDVSACP